MWVDITQINIRVTRGIVYLSGHLVRMTASHSEFDPQNLRELDSRLRRIREAQDVKYRLSNWQRNLHGDWSPIVGVVINAAPESDSSL